CDASAAAAQPNGLGLGNQIADGEHQSVAADQYSAPHPLGAQRLRREGVGGDDGLDPHHRGQRTIKIVVIVLWFWLHGPSTSRSYQFSCARLPWRAQTCE